MPSGVLRLTPPAAAAAAFANMLARRWRSRLSATGLPFLASTASPLAPFLRFLALPSSSISSSDAPGAGLDQSSSSPMSTCLEEGEV